MSKEKHIASTLLLAALSINALGVAPALADELQTYNLDTVVVTAQRETKRDVDTPASVTSLSAKQLADTGAANLFDALSLQSGITAYSYGGNGQSLGGMNAKILMRGANKGTVVMIDGVPANINETYYLDTMPVETIERVEILKGAASTLYGSEASSGVINIITKKKMPNTISLTKGEYGKAKESVTLNADKLNLAVALEQGDPIKGLASSYKAINDINKKSYSLSYKFDDNWRLSHQHNDNKFSFDQYDKTWSKLAEDANYHYIDDFTRLQYKDDSITANLFYNRSNRRNQTYKVKNDKFEKWNKLDHVRFDTIGIDLQKQIESKLADIIIGTNISRDSYKNDALFSGSKAINGHLNYFKTNYALFAQLSKDLGAGYTATVGARETLVKSGDKNYDAFTPQFALMKKLDDNSSLYVNAAKSFRMPTFTQLYGGGSATYEHNPYLQPEEGWTYEFGYKKVSESSLFKTALYYMDMDAITYKGSTLADYKIVNTPFENLGMEITYDKEIGSKYSYSLGMNLCNPKSKSEKGIWERQFARQQYNASLKYHDDKFTAALTGMFTTERASGWGDLLPVNFVAGYKFDKSSKLEFGVENIFDRDDIVSNPGSSTKYYCLPRNVHITYTYTF